jgi:hypothetical protein
MAQSRPSVQKRLNDAKKAERKLQKAAKKAARAELQAANRAADKGEGDPDLAGIVAGPQPRRDDEEEGDWPER